MPIAERRARSAGAIESAFGHHNAVAGNSTGEAFADGKGGLEGAEVAVVDADQAGFQPQSALKLIFLMNFKQDIHPIGKGGIFDGLSRRVVDRRHDDEDTIGAQRAGLDDLIGLVDEILAQRRQAGRIARLAEEFRSALERGSIGEHGQARRAARLIGFGQ